MEKRPTWTPRHYLILSKNVAEGQETDILIGVIIVPWN